MIGDLDEGTIYELTLDANGKIDQPSDLFVYGEKLVISNFDLMSKQGW